MMGKSKAQAVLLLAILSIIWGSSFILMKKGLTAYSPVQVASLRICIAGLVFLPYVLTHLKKIQKLKFIILFALLEVGIPPYLYTIAQTKIDSSTAGILNSLVPLFTLLSGFVIYKINANLLKVVGVLIGLLGAVLLIFFDPSKSASFNLSNVLGLLVVLATLMYGIGGNILKEHLSEVPSVLITAVSFVSMSIPASILLFSTDIFSIPLSDSANLQALGAITILSLIGSALAIVLFNVLIKKSNALFGSFITYFIPFVAILWGALDNEPINYMHFLSVLIIISGIYIANKGMKDNNGDV